MTPYTMKINDEMSNFDDYLKPVSSWWERESIDNPKWLKKVNLQV